ncbi:MAG: Amt family ammonium transporter [Nitriliruptoraceae bacterium]
MIAFSFSVTWVLAKALAATIGLRVDEEAEWTGLDRTEHAAAGYSLSSIDQANALS